jgi:hypothetical protein
LEPAKGAASCSVGLLIVLGAVDGLVVGVVILSGGCSNPDSPPPTPEGEGGGEGERVPHHNTGYSG